MSHLFHSQDAGREDDAPPPYEEVDSRLANPPNHPSRPNVDHAASPASPASLEPPPWQHGQSVGQGSGFPRPHSAREPFRPSPSPSPRPSPIPRPKPAASPRPSHLSPHAYPGQQAMSSRRRPHSTSNPPAPRMIPRQFPPAFNVYQQAFSRTLYLAEHQVQPIYALTVHSGLGQDASLVLHSGASEQHPPLATLDYAVFGAGMAVTLPPAAFPGAPTTIEAVRGPGLNESLIFVIDVGNGNMGPRSRGGRWPLEQFEWRRSRGEAVAMLDGCGYGWKLVRLAEGPPPETDSQGDMRHVSYGPRGSDGSEAVAVWSETGYSMSKAMRFAFLGTGASGLLGERWAIMAVMTALGMFQRARNTRQRRRMR